MDERRMGVIALKLYQALRKAQEEIDPEAGATWLLDPGNPGFQRNLGQIAKQTGVSISEWTCFSKIIFRKMDHKELGLERQQELALMYHRYLMRCSKKIKVGTFLRRKLGKIAEEMEIDFNDLLEFFRTTIVEHIDEIFKPKKLRSR